MKILKKLLLSFSIITMIFIFSCKVNALEVMSKEVFEYIMEQTAPEDLDLSLKNGTIYSDKYLKEMKEFNEKLQISNNENHYGITDINQLYYTVSIIFYLSIMK